MGLFSSSPSEPVVQRADLDKALAAIHPKDADSLVNRTYSAELLNSIPRTDEILAVAPSTSMPGQPSDRGVLCLHPTNLVLRLQRSSPFMLPLRNIAQAGMTHRGMTLAVLAGGREFHFSLATNKGTTNDAFAAKVLSAVEIAATAQRAPSAEPATASAAEEIGRFAALRDSGVLTEAEFAAKKAQLLG